MAWLSGWDKRKEITLTGGASGAQTDFQLSLSVTYDSNMLSNFDDLRFTQSDGTTLIDAWLESKIDSTSAIVWVKFPTTPTNTVEQTYYMYYGKTGAINNWNGSNTFIQWHGSTTDIFLDPIVIPYSNVAFESKSRAIGSDHNVYWGMKVNTPEYHSIYLESFTPNAKRYFISYNNNIQTVRFEPPIFTPNIWYKLKITNDGTTAHGYVDDNEMSLGITTNLPGTNLGLFQNSTTGTSEQEYSFARKFVVNPATYIFGSEEILLTKSSIWYYNMLKRRN